MEENNNRNRFFSSDDFSDLMRRSFYDGSVSSFNSNAIENLYKNNLININSSIEKGKIINEITDLIKCYICLDKIKEPKMCHYCHRLVCGECIRKWLNLKNTCGFCRNRVTRLDFIDVPFMANIKSLLEYNKNLEEKKANLEDTNKKLEEKLNSNICKMHNEKILYYCINCNKKLCGKCTSFINKDAKIHENHKVFEYSELEESKYIDIINILEKKEEKIKKIDHNLEKCEEIKNNDIKKLDKEKNILDIVYKEINNYYREKNNIIIENSKNLKIIQKKYNKKCKYINDNLQNIESLDKPINGFNIEEVKKDIEKYQTEIIKIENKINQDLKKNILLELKSFNFLFEKEYDSIIKEKIIISINAPIKINFSLQIIKKDLLSIIFPISINTIEEKEKNKKKRKINLIPLLQINDIMYTEFKKEQESSLFFDDIQDIKKNGNNIIVDEDEDDKEIKNMLNNIKFNDKNLNKINIEEENKNKNIEIDDEENDNYKYIFSIKLNELIKGVNKFQLQ